jgi:hypothetical protein
MKRIITLVFLIVFALPSMAQHVDYDNDSRWFLGLNIGGTWNTTDIKNRTYAGAGFIFGKQFNYNYGRRTSFDLRFRYLGGIWYGQDYDTTSLLNYSPAYMPFEYDAYKSNPGYTVNNFKTRTHEVGLELAIHANALRERTGWDPYIFGGLNFAWNQTTSDLLNIDSSLFMQGYYDYTGGVNESSISSMMDGDYETAMNAGSELNGWNVNFVPSLGFGLGYQVGPRFSLGVEHKTSFALKNDWDGFDVAVKKWGMFDNDLYHYTSGYLRFHIWGGGNVNTNIDNPDPLDNNLTDQNCPTPVIRMINPTSTSTTVDQQMYSYSASVENISARENLVLRVNGQVTAGYFYNATSKTVDANILLLEGTNTIELVASNGCGQDVETVTVVYETCRVPEIRLSQPAYNNVTVESAQFTIRASVLNNANTVSMTVNGSASNNFFYNASNGSFESSLNLREGANTIQITAVNACGTDTEIITVNYSNCIDPVVIIANPTGTTVSLPAFNYNVEVQNVASKNDIVVRLNGVNQTFTYNAQSKRVTGVATLRQGSNTIEVMATNQCGVNTQTITVIYDIPCIVPTITMLSPVGSAQTQASTQVVKATITQVTNANQVQMRVNGVVIPGGTYSASTKIYTHTANLQEGSNTIEIIATNDCGPVSQTVIVNKSTCQLPSIAVTSPANNSTTESGSLAFQATISGVTSSSQVVLTVNGVNVSNGASLTNGLYRKTLSLQVGTNVILITATNACGTVNETVVVTYAPCIVPTVTITSPVNNAQTNNANITLNATVLNAEAANNVQLMLNGHVVAGGTFNMNNGQYSHSLNLQEGANTIKLTVTTACGTDSKTITVNYTAPCELPVINLTSPQSSTFTTDQGSIFIQATVNGVNSAGITTTVNGVAASGATYNQSSGAYAIRVTLLQGANQIVISATNNCGTVTETLLVNYVPCVAPSVSIATPPNNAQLTNSTMALNAVVLNAESANNVQLLLNGAAVAGASFNVVTGSYQHVLNLQEGTNTIKLIVTTSCGTDSKSITVNYTAPCDLPTINLVSPQTSPFTSDEGSVYIQATVTGVTAAGITTTVNGVVTGGATYNQNTGAYAIRVTAIQATNQVLITATNACGTVSETLVINYTPCLEPTVTIFEPVNNFQTTNAIVSFQATVENATALNQMTFVVNGSIVGGGSYNPVTKQYTNQANLQAGANTLMLKVITDCGSDTKSVSITRNEIVDDIPVQEEMITICHRPPGNPNNMQQLTIPLSAWPAHQAHGDILGPCPVQEEEQEEESNEDNLNNVPNPGGNPNNPARCMPTVGATFFANALQVTATSTLDLSNVVLLFCDGSTQKIEGLSGLSGNFSGTGGNSGKCIVGIWIKSGCNQSNDGPGYGEFVANAAVPANCCSNEENGNNQNQEETEEEQNEDNINAPVPVRPRPGTQGGGNEGEGDRRAPKGTNTPVRPGGGRP